MARDQCRDHSHHDDLGDDCQIACNSDRQVAEQRCGLIAPGSPENSYLYLKISSATPPRGTMMPPPTTGDSLSTAEMATIMSWIQSGAPNN